MSSFVDEWCPLAVGFGVSSDCLSPCRTGPPLASQKALETLLHAETEPRIRILQSA